MSFQAEDVSASLLDSEEEDRESLTCAVCLDIYFSPYSCQPCGHVFCEPCLRTIAKNRPAYTPCPLCRTLISQTIFSKGNGKLKRRFILQCTIQSNIGEYTYDQQLV